MPQDDGPYRYFVIEAAILFPPAFSFIQRRKAERALARSVPEKAMRHATYTAAFI
jgi:hypothetical protein